MENGLTLCDISDIPDGGAKGVEVDRGAGTLDLILLRQGNQVFAYVNSCPHTGTPLETFPDRFLDSAGKLLICSTHGARFRVRDGVCVAGPCKGESLRPARVHVRGGSVVLSRAERQTSDAQIPPKPLRRKSCDERGA